MTLRCCLLSLLLLDPHGEGLVAGFVLPSSLLAAGRGTPSLRVGGKSRLQVERGAAHAPYRDWETSFTPTESDYNFQYSDVATRRALTEARGRAYEGPPLKVLVLGKPCSGKGTLAPMIARALRGVYVCTGNLLRAEVKAQTTLGKIAQEQMQEGQMLPSELMRSMVRGRLNAVDSRANGWVLDGFPRTPKQAKMLLNEDLLPDAIIVLERSDDLVREMCLGRMTDSATGVIYHPKFNPPPPEVQARLVWRLDDTEEVLTKRLLQYADSRDALMACFNNVPGGGNSVPIPSVVVDTGRSDIHAFEEAMALLDRVSQEKAERMGPEAVAASRELIDARMGDIEEIEPLQPSLALQDASLLPADHFQTQRDQTDTSSSSSSSSSSSPGTSTSKSKGSTPALILPPSTLDPRKKAAEQQLESNKPGPLLAAVQRCNEHDIRNYLRVFIDDLQVGFVGKKFCNELRPYVGSAVEIVPDEGGVEGSQAVQLAPYADSVAKRTRVLGGLVQSLVEAGAIPRSSIRKELQDVHAVGTVSVGDEEPLVRLERAAMIYFGIPSYGVHINAYVEDPVTLKKKMWIATRSLSKPSYGGKLDQMVAGGQPSGITLMENVRKECEEEASVPWEVVKNIVPTGLVSYRYATRKGLSTKILMTYDLKLDPEFVPFNGDGEVDGFSLLSFEHVLDSLTHSLPDWKPNSALVVIDFAVRHGYLDPDDKDFMKICHLLRSSSVC